MHLALTQKGERVCKASGPKVLCCRNQCRWGAARNSKSLQRLSGIYSAARRQFIITNTSPTTHTHNILHSQWLHCGSSEEGRARCWMIASSLTPGAGGCGGGHPCILVNRFNCADTPAVSSQLRRTEGAHEWNTKPSNIQKFLWLMKTGLLKLINLIISFSQKSCSRQCNISKLRKRQILNNDLFKLLQKK